jgi:Leucine rich repeat
LNLNLWKKHLGHVPDSIWDQTDLETLVLADNDLSEVSDRIGDLKKLRMLDLGHNRLISIPDAIADLDGLTDFLYLHDNRLTSLPSSLEHLTKLRYLNFSENVFRFLARMRLRYDRPDRAPCVGQPSDFDPRFGRASFALARIASQK